MTPDQLPIIYIVATPLGHQDDLSPRAIRILQEVDIIAAEDTRRARSLLSRLEIEVKRLVSYWDHTERKQASSLLEMIKSQGLSLAVISDAGTPGIADPGYHITRLAHQSKVRVVPIPGPSALTSLVSASGLPSDRLLFVGFLPRKEKALREEITGWRRTRATIVAFESAARLRKSLAILRELSPYAEICIGRELTKTFEEIALTTINEALLWCDEHSHLKGEVSLAIRLDETLPAQDQDIDRLDERIRVAARAGCRVSDMKKIFVDSPLSKKQLYERLVSIHQQETTKAENS